MEHSTHPIKKEHWIHSILQFVVPSRHLMIISIFLAIVSVIGGLVPYVAIYYILKLLIDGTQTINSISYWVFIASCGYFVQTVFHALSSYYSHRVAYSILENIRLQLAERLLRAPLGHIINRPVGNMKNIIVDRVETLELPLAHIIPEGLSNIILTIGIFIYLLTIDYRMALATLITVPIALIIYIIMMHNFNSQYKNYMESSNHVNSVIVEYVEGIEVIKTFNQTNKSYKKFAHAITSFKDFTLNWFRSTWPLMTLGNAILPSTLVGTLPVGLLLYQNGTIEPAELIISLTLSMGLIHPLMQITTFVNDFKSIEYAVNDTKDYLHLEALPVAPTHNLVPTHFQIEMNHIAFGYNEEHTVIRDLSLTIPERNYTALVGHSGSGKSTIARLMTRFWDVSDGSINIGGINIKDIHPNDFSKIISYVAQDNFLFRTSILENIRMGNPNASDDEIFHAARLSRCDEFIKALPNGYQTDSGEAGKKLSGGEKQRLAIARAILKDAPIIILDEATAFTDPENEAEIQKAFNELASNKTLIVIAHRLSTIKHADQIVVLQNGDVHTIGTHDQLLQNNDLYQKLWQAHIGTRKKDIQLDNVIKEGHSNV